MPSGENATDLTLSECPFSVRFSVPVRTSRIRIVLSAIPHAITRPSGEKATDQTASGCAIIRADDPGLGLDLIWAEVMTDNTIRIRPSSRQLFFIGFASLRWRFRCLPNQRYQMLLLPAVFKLSSSDF